MRKIILALYLIALMPLFAAEKKKKVNFFQGLFTDRIERVYIIMKDGMPFKHTDHYENKLCLSVGRLEEVLKKFKDENYRIKDIAIIIHNHLKDYRFSDLDRKEHMRLKKHGFNGLFMLYSHMTNKTYCLEEK